MRKILLLLILSFYFCEIVLAQNNVPNSGFEIVVPCPTTLGQMVSAFPWDDLSGASGNSDAYHACNATNSFTNCNSNGVPFSAAGYSFPRSGDGFSGLIAYQSGNTREYISTPLTSPLLPGNVYEVSFWVKKARYSRYACNKIGAALSNGSLIQAGSNALGIVPSVETNQVITDSINWQFISNMYVALGGEDHITIGNFRNDVNTSLLDLGLQGSSCSDMNSSAYYYIDDVSIIPFVETTAWSGDTLICKGQSTNINAISNVPVWWSTLSAPMDTIGTLNTITLSPSVSTTYIIHGLFTQQLFSISVLDTPLVELGSDTAICEDVPFLLNAQNSGSSYSWSNGATQQVIAPFTSGTYWVDVNNGACIVRDSIDLIMHPIPVSELNELYFMCSDDQIFPSLYAGNAQNYIWNPVTDSSSSIIAVAPGVYSVLMTTDQGCTLSDSAIVIERCDYRLFIPNAFTPDGDGLNDYFIPYTENLSLYHLRIYNRWGQMVFSSENPFIGWDGTFENEESPNGVYVYRLDFKAIEINGSETNDSKCGHFILYR
ncbi:MAG TPA: gliding motility-associated C-terminal domain-containing protein [Bacteroidia bacterium]|nr:gliding motility-associated C-terminal domain-containing protein [Bacteroidia bacterium]HNT80394.1 gliding motility-associated C-terminal domain-containing protein [Bacteroidia bacterium]